MSAYLNEVKLIGRVGRPPEFSTTNDNRKIAKLSIATSKHWKDKETGERKEKTEWHKVTVFSNKIAEVIENYVSQGDLVLIEGTLQYEKWVDPNGQERKTTNIVVDLSGKFLMLGRREKNSSDEEAPAAPSNTSNSASTDDEIPF